MSAKRALFIIAPLAICVTAWAADKADHGKYAVEASTKNTIATSSSPGALPELPPNGEALAQPNLDIGKGRIEAKTELILAEQVENSSPPAATSDPAVFVNPKVEPGKVRWHATLDEARDAARKSGKPVLLFQMMGNLDDRFC